MSSLFGPGMMLIFFIFFAALIFLYIMSIFWARKDAKARGANEKFAMVISLIPFAGVLAYVLMRPPLLLIDKEEQELDIALKRRQLNKYGTCPNCGELIEADYLVCPKCQIKLRDACPNCSKPLDPKWKACPYCSTPTDRSNASIPQKEIKSPKEDASNSKTDYKVEDSFNFDKDVFEEADIDLDDITNPKHRSLNTKKTNTHN